VARAHRKPHAAALAFDALTVEGALIAPAMLARIAERNASGQADADYNVPKGVTLRDEIARYFRIGQALFTDLFASAAPSAAATTRFVEALLRDVFGFSDISQTGMRTLGDRAYPVTLEARGGRVPVVVFPPSDEIDAPSLHLPSEGRRRSAASALQDWLNAGGDALWGLCSNGTQLRLLRANASLTRPAFIQADLRRIFDGEVFADFAALWLLVHATRFGVPGSAPSDCPLEHWREAGGKEGVAARERLRDGVEAALLSLGGGFLAQPDNTALRERLASGALPLTEYFGQLLRLVYRLIFLFAAEDRNLLHPPSASAAARRLYAEGYSLGLLRDRAVRRAAWDRHHDRWEGLLIVFGALARGERRLGLPALGGMFEPGTIHDLDRARLANRDLMEAIYRLAWLREDAGLAPVNWRDMETEELGSVYESLLELTPRLTEDGRGFAFAEGGEGQGHARKTSGSYYTPDSLVQLLLDSALGPVLDRVEAEAEDPTAALLSVTVIDPACGSGHFLLAAARRIATRLARHRAQGLTSGEDYRRALRDVVRASIHGVDRNPLAVELTKVALWIETVDPGKPLGFLDPNIRCGDALLGVFDLNTLAAGIPDAACKPLTGDDKAAARYYAARNRDEKRGQGALDFAHGGGRLPAAAPLAAAARALHALPEDSLADIAERRRRFQAGRADPRLWTLQVACDLYTAAFLAPKTGGVPENRNTVTIPTTGHLWQQLRGGQLYGPLVAAAQDIAGEAHAFHWPLEFSDIMAAGGFDVVLGNPPWEVMQLSEEEYFAQRLPEISELTGAARKRAIAALELDNAVAFTAYQEQKRRSEASNEFARNSGRFDLTARGKINTYALFAELVAGLTGLRGRAGVIVPTGIATDGTTAPFFATLMADGRLVRVISFENEEFIFSSIHHSFRFCLLTCGQLSAAARPEFTFFIRRLEQLAERERWFTLSEREIAQINPNTKTAPIFRSRADAGLTAKICGNLPVLLDENSGLAGNPWGISVATRLWNMAEDSHWFRTAADLAAAGYVREGTDWVGEGCYLPLYEAKMIHQFDHRWATFDGNQSRDTTLSEKQQPTFEPIPRYWVPEHEVAGRLQAQGWTRNWLIGWRNVTSAHVLRTLIATAFPRVAAGHTMALVFVNREPPLAAALLSSLLSLVVDYVARQKIGGTHLTYSHLTQFPVLLPSAYTEPDLAFIVPRVIELTYTSHSMAPFARDLGHDVQPFRWDEERRAQMRAELDAFYARAYGLSRDELRYILDPEDAMGKGYPSETFRVLKTNEIRRFGEYRTARLVLAAWDAQEERLAAAQ
jgi:hypothetical protein